MNVYSISDLKALIYAIKQVLLTRNIKLSHHKIYTILARALGYGSEFSLKAAIPFRVDMSRETSRRFTELVNKTSNTKRLSDEFLVLFIEGYARFPIINDDDDCFIVVDINYGDGGFVSWPYIAESNYQGTTVAKMNEHCTTISLRTECITKEQYEELECRLLPWCEKIAAGYRKNIAVSSSAEFTDEARANLMDFYRWLKDDELFWDIFDDHWSYNLDYFLMDGQIPEHVEEGEGATTLTVLKKYQVSANSSNRYLNELVGKLGASVDGPVDDKTVFNHLRELRDQLVLNKEIG